MKRAFLGLAVTAWATLVAGLLIVFLADIPEFVPAEAILLVAFAGPAMIASLLWIGWLKDMDYPFPWQRKKAVVLWLYGLPPALLVFLFVWKHPVLPWWANVAVPVLLFVLMTTFTFGILPGYGGAYHEYAEIRRLKGELWERGHRERRGRKADDPVFVGVEVCATCLTAVLPEDEKCGRCGSWVRWEARYRDMWTRGGIRWKKEFQEGKPFWVRVWHPRYTYQEEGGAYMMGMKVETIFAHVYDDGRWFLYAFVWTHSDLDVARVREGRETTSRAARREVERVAGTLDFRALVESRRKRSGTTSPAT